MAYPVFYPVAGTTLYIPFATYDGGTGASITLTGLAASDIEIYKAGSVTQRASDNGYTLLDTDGIDFDSITGIHGFSIDLSDDTDSGFYAVGSQYFVVVSSVTIDGQTVNFIAAWFEIVSATRRLAGTALPAAAADAAGGLVISDAGGLDIDAKLAATNEVTAARMGALTDWIDGGRLDLLLDAILTDTGTTLQGELDAIEAAVITNAAGTDIAADIIALKTVADAILVDTGTTLDGKIDVIDGNVDDIETLLLLTDADVEAILEDTSTTLDALIDAIKAKTDSLTFTVANQVDANVQYINDTALTGNGASGTEWGPA